jgi:ABC-type nitrate/sulfonate/bicarbonate transport system substrate-binding protein
MEGDEMRKAIFWTVVLAMLAAFAALPANGLAQVKEVKIAGFPFGHHRAFYQYWKDAGIHKEVESKFNVRLNVQFIQDDFAAWAGKKVDVGFFSALEIARVRTQNNWDAVQFGVESTGYVEWYVRKDSSYKSVKDLKGKKIGLPGWDTSAAQDGTVMVHELFGLNLRKDFRVIISRWPALPSLLARGDVEAIANLYYLTLPQMEAGKFRILFGTYAKEWQKRTGHLGLSVTHWTAFADWLDKNTNGARAILYACTKAQTYFMNNTDAFLAKYHKFFRKKSTPAQRSYMAKWIQRIEPVVRDCHLTPDYVKKESEYLQAAAKLGLVDNKGIQGLFRIIR